MSDEKNNARLSRGPELSACFASGQFRPTGQCDGVIYFGAVTVPDGFDADGRILTRVVSSSRQNAALRYLRPMEETQRIAQGRAHGFAMPVGFADFMANRTPGMRDAAQSANAPLCVLLACSPAAIDALQPEHAGRWRSYPVEPGVWGVLYE